MLHKTSKNRLSRWYVQLQETRRLGELPVDMERSSDIDESCNIHQGFTLILSNVCLIHCKYPKKLPNKAGNQIIFRFIFCDLNQIVDFNHPQISTNIPFSTCAILAPCGTSRIWVDEVKLLLEAARSSVPSKFFAIPSRIQDFHPKKSEKKKKTSLLKNLLIMLHGLRITTFSPNQSVGQLNKCRGETCWKLCFFCPASLNPNIQCQDLLPKQTFLREKSKPRALKWRYSL